MLKTILLICIAFFTANQLTAHTIADKQQHLDIQFKGAAGNLQNNKWKTKDVRGPYYYGCGAQLQFQKPQGKIFDDTAANGLRIRYCGSIDWTDQYTQQIRGDFGDWKGMKLCPPYYYIMGVVVRDQIDMGTGDNTGVNGLQIVCRMPFDYLAKMDSSKFIVVYEGLQGNWKQLQDKTNVMQGFKVLYQTYLSSNIDNTGMNGLYFKMAQFKLGYN